MLKCTFGAIAGKDIFIDKCKFFARHGVMEQERSAGNEFEVSIRVGLMSDKIYPKDFSRFEHQLSKGLTETDPDDNLLTTVSYVDIYQIAKEEMEQPRNLLETVARRIAQRIFIQFEAAQCITVEIIKLTPPISGFSGSAGVNYQLHRDTFLHDEDSDLPF